MEGLIKTEDLCWAAGCFGGHADGLDMSEAGEVDISARVGTQ